MNSRPRYWYVSAFVDGARVYIGRYFGTQAALTSALRYVHCYVDGEAIVYRRPPVITGGGS